MKLGNSFVLGVVVGALLIGTILAWQRFTREKVLSLPAEPVNGTSRDGVLVVDSDMVKRASFKGKWPLVPSEVELSCHPVTGNRNVQSLTFIYSGREYALNGIAEGHGFADPDALWLDNESIPGSKVDISDLIEAARSRCEHPAPI